MKLLPPLFIALFLLFFITVAISEELNEERIIAFSKKINQINNEDTQEFFSVLSKDFTLEFNVGSNVHGFILSFDNENLINFLQKIANYPEDETEVKDIYDINLSSSTEGDFKVIIYSEKYNKKIWTHYFVRLENNKIKVTKILEKM